MTATATTSEKDAFQPVLRKKRNRKNRNKLVVVVDKTVENHIESLNEKRRAIEECTAFINKFDEALDKLKQANSSIKQIRCLALGSPTDWVCSYAAMHQLALLQIIASRLNIDSDQITVWDPVFTEEDKEIFDKLGLRTLEIFDCDDNSKEGLLYYMPHAPVSLIDQVLGSRNGIQESHRNFQMIGNVLTDFSTRISDADMLSQYPSLDTAIKSLDKKLDDWLSFDIPNDLSAKEPFAQAFNCLAVTAVSADLANNSSPEKSKK